MKEIDRDTRLDLNEFLKEGLFFFLFFLLFCF